MDTRQDTHHHMDSDKYDNHNLESTSLYNNHLHYTLCNTQLVYDRLLLRIDALDRNL